MMAHRLMAEYYQFLEEFESAVELCRKLKGLIATAMQDTGLKFERYAL